MLYCDPSNMIHTRLTLIYGLDYLPTGNFDLFNYVPIVPFTKMELFHCPSVFLISPKNNFVTLCYFRELFYSGSLTL